MNLKKLLGNAPRLVRDEPMVFFILCKWYLSHPWSFIGEMLGVWEKTGIGVLLAAKFGYNVGFIGYVIFCVILTFVFVFIGRIMVMTRIIRTTVQAGNSQNPELMKIIEKLAEIKQENIEIGNRFNDFVKEVRDKLR